MKSIAVDNPAGFLHDFKSYEFWQNHSFSKLLQGQGAY